MRGNLKPVKEFFGRAYPVMRSNSQLRWILHYKENGKWVQRVSEYAQTRQDAIEELNAKFINNRNAALGLIPKVKRTSFKEFRDTFLKSYVEARQLASKRSIECYLEKLEAFFGSTPLDEITADSIGQLITFLRKRSKKSQRKGEVTNSTVNRCIALLRKMLRYAVSCRCLEKEHLPEFSMLQENPSRNRVLTLDEEKRLLQACAPHLRPFITTAIHTGRRWGEIRTLAWDRVDFQNRWIEFNLTKSRMRTTITNPMNNTLLEMLKSMPRKSPYVFPNPNTGKPYTTIKTAFTAACRRAGIKGLRFHDLRHTALTRVAERGANAFDVQRLAGHADIRTTQRYVNSTEERLRLVGFMLDENNTVPVNLPIRVN
jgi:integrase